jgi:hypothetical protein
MIQKITGKNNPTIPPSKLVDTNLRQFEKLGIFMTITS